MQEEQRFYVSKHAHERLKQRWPELSPAKIHKVARKAWKSRETSAYLESERFNAGHTRDPDCAYRLFHGMIFVFGQITCKTPVLVTVIRNRMEVYH